MERVYNFSAGPSTLPVEVLKQVQEDLISYKGAGMSVMEMSHRSPVYQQIIDDAKQDLIDLMNIPDDYDVLFLQGDASTQFAMIPMNLGVKGKAQYLNTGTWSTKAIKEAQKLGMDVDVVASSEDKTFSYVPKITADQVKEDIDYFHITSNNTIYGTAVKNIPDTKGAVLISDMSSDILSKPVNVSDYGMIYAGAQKNMGPAGVTVVIIRKDLIGKADASVPTMMNYKTHADKGSMFNTPPTFSIYVAGVVLKYLKEIGGLEAIEKINVEKADMLYDYLDSTEFYSTPVAVEDRSIMNVTFKCQTDELNAAFLKGAAEKGMVNLKGHRSVGGMRASIYNAMPVEGVKALVDYMKEFEAANK